MSYQKNLASIILLLIAGFQLRAQTEKYQLSAVIPPSATAASLGKYGEIPVSLYTGIPNISIPLYEIKDGSIGLPLSLSYHAGGIKVEEIASAVGLGWALNFGGMINRQQRGKPDEYNWTGRSVEDRIETLVDSNDVGAILDKTIDIAYSDFDGEPDVFSYSFNGQSGKFFFDEAGAIYTYPARNITVSLSGSGWKIVAEDGTAYEYVSAEQVLTYYDETYTGWYLNKITSADGKRQITLTYEGFSYSYDTFFGQTKYFSTNAQQGVCNPDGTGLHYGGVLTYTQRIKQINFNGGYIKFNYNTNRQDFADAEDKSLDLIEIYTSKNSLIKKYAFAYSYFGSGGSTEYEKRLRLDSLTEKSAVGQKPPYVFTYNEAITMPDRRSFARDHWGYYNGKTNNNTVNSLIPSFTYTGGTYNGADRETDTAYAQACILKKINYPTGGVTRFTFESNTIFDHNLVTTTEKNFSSSLNQSFTSLTSPYETDTFSIPSQGASVKLTVNGITSSGSGGNCEFGVSCSLVKDGVIFNGVTDCPNGITANLPGGIYKFLFEFDCYAGSLNYTINLQAKIPNTTLGGWRAVGGLRIKEMEDVPGDGGLPVVRKFRYQNEYDTSKSSGVLINYPDYDGHLLNTEVKNFDGSCMGTEYYNCSDLVKQSTTNYPLATTQGSYVGYSHVVEDMGDNGEIRHSYFTYSNTIYNQDFPYAPSESYDWRRGNEWKTRYYAKKNGQLVLAKSVDYTYGSPGPLGNVRTIYGLKTGIDHVVLSNNFGCFINNALPTLYKIYYVITEFYALTKKTERVYDQDNLNKYVETTTDYTYDTTHYQLVQTRTSVSSKDSTVRDEVVVITKYPQNYVFTGSPSNDDAWGIKKLQDLHIFNVPVEQYSYRQTRNITTNAVSNQRVTGGTITTFNYSNSYPNKVYRLETNTPISLATYGSGSGLSSNAFIKNSNSTVANAYKTAVVFNSYDTSGNLTMQQKANDVYTSYLWGYGNNYPVAQVVGATYSTISSLVNQSILNNPVSDLALRNELNKLRTGLAAANAQVSTYTYKPLIGTTSVTDPNNRTIYYEYDHFNRLMLVRDQDRSIIQQICYNYAGQIENCNIYYNTAQSGNYTKNDCGSGYIGNSVTYTVPANTYSSPISVDSANAIAIRDKQANGQAYANANGTCTSLINIYYYDFGSTGEPVYFTFTNLSTYQQYNFQTDPDSVGTHTVLGQLPPGNYEIDVYNPANYYHYYTFGCYGNAYGYTTANCPFAVLEYDVNNYCNTINIDPW